MDSIYLDTCIISGLAKEDLAEAEYESVVELLRLHKTGKIKVVTSQMTLNELEKIPSQARKKHEVFYLLLENVKISEVKRLIGIIGVGIIPFEQEDPIYSRLRTILPDENDAHHIFHALKNNCAYFVTTDRKTILKHRTKLFKEFGEFMVMSPNDMMELLSVQL